ncbi:GAF domain-containing protein [Lichenicola cladoniae]|uniref:histidine kinase n=1 Tax=Lichenicola cladoniae TaxID=1484109 RepID=A0A6M8HUC8_9PROT|nr:GAF domain-containing protein [Lichenicola cladoniae]NPD70446.1 GAF domain-containing protein [Acetobacteraceae bacterium]QKE91920.1 GAF domain-containing protein [Lichenicola cladoniae]
MSILNMRPPENVSDEQRLASLARFEILDTAPEQGYDDIVRLASQICDTSVALVSFVANDRQWFKARVGFEPCETDLSRSVCVHALEEDDLLVIPDLSRDPRTASNPLVTEAPSVRFYAGAPLRTADGMVLGSLCVIDGTPRPIGLTTAQQDGLRSLACHVVHLLELRQALADRRRVEDALRAKQQELQVSEARWRGLFERLGEGFIIGELVWNKAGRVTDWRYIDVNAAWGELVSIDPGHAIGRTIRELFPDIEESWIQTFAEVVDTGTPIAFTQQVGSLQRWYDGRAFRVEEDRFGVLFLEVTERVQADARREALVEIGERLRDLATISDMTRFVTGIVGRVLSVQRAAFGQLTEDKTCIQVELDWTAPGVDSIAGLHCFADYGDLGIEMLDSDPLVIADVSTDDRTTAGHQRFSDLGIRSLVNMPVRDQNQTVALLIVHDDHPRAWSLEELGFMRSVADRLEFGVSQLRAKADQLMLNQEISHRMKNMLAMVQAIAQQTMNGVEDQDAVKAFGKRLYTLSAAHDVLLQQSWVSTQLGTLVRAILSTFGANDRFDIAGPDLLLGPRATLSLSMLLHELAMNAIKYGALSTASGRIALHWRLARVSAPELVFCWEETGGPSVAPPTRKGFGSRLIRSGLLGTGGVDLRYEVTGFSAEMRALLDQVQLS